MKKMIGTRRYYKLLLLTLISLISGKKLINCPIKCFCYSDDNDLNSLVSCSNQKLKEFPDNLSEIFIQDLDLSINLLEIVPEEIGQLIELKYLNLSRNNIKQLPNEIKELWKLEKLDLSHNNINNVNDINVISRLPNLKYLYLKNNNINSLDGLNNLALKVLDISHCMISGLKNESLIGFPQLISLNLDKNPLKLIDHVKSLKLKWIDLSNCMLNFLHPDTFEYMPELEQLRMANNPILVHSTRKETLKHKNLKRLDLTGCNLDRPGLEGFPSLTHAILTKNSINFLPNRIFSNNKMLIKLYLNNNNINSINENTFNGNTKLELLDLSNNNIKYIPSSKLFQDNYNLKLLNLSYNNIKDIPFNLTTYTLTFDLNSNLIEQLSSDLLLNMPRIKNLYLNNNRLEIFIGKSKTLIALNLGGNRLIKLSEESLSNLPMLTKIDLSGNRLTEGMNYAFKNNHQLKSINLEDNPWRCDCQQLYPTYIYLIKSLKMYPSNLICQSPGNVSGYSWYRACQKHWNIISNDKNNKSEVIERTYGLVLMALLMSVLFFASIISITHSIKSKRRQAAIRLREMERAEALERLILHRRNREQRDESRPGAGTDTTNGNSNRQAELIGPPTYEEAVQMPRIARSLDNLDSGSTDPSANQSTNRDISWRKRRMLMRKRMAANRAKSENQLATGHQDEQTDRNRKTFESTPHPKRINRNKLTKRVYLSNRELQRRRSIDESSNSKRKKKFHMNRDDDISDDEDSDVLKHSLDHFPRKNPSKQNQRSSISSSSSSC